MSGETFRVDVDGRSFEITIHEDRVVVDGSPVEASVARVSDHTYSLLVDGRSHEFTISENGTASKVTGIGGTAEVSVYDRIAQLLLESQAAARHVHATEVKAPMPGLVLKLEVEPGDTVHAGTGLVVLEAMKMENEIFATGEAVVESVHVKPGQAVAKGQLLVTLQ